MRRPKLIARVAGALALGPMTGRELERALSTGPRGVERPLQELAALGVVVPDGWRHNHRRGGACKIWRLA